MSDRRARASRLRLLLEQSPRAAQAYEDAKQVVRAFRKPAFYEVATRCNLLCEGCYYFSDNFTAVEEVKDPA
ncbi:MAG: hypothetical protein JO276_17555, partial [Sphingomonadaceae bacterium]|nr:hypothetical protein [Sphingomonadaceae bacterium]